ncbi:MAG: hypothetical protein AMJ88_03240 [Anaerolineae bacterium SM23_ 63]|nr:MAG: hypothetical protein AMJ88_03240 [Anaerolineae bacterium SM23_ 63]HEY47576.1 hypothetical protein [Anaerolineae bacterium]
MVSLIVVFGILIILFAVIGAMRGWAKELLVTSSVVLALFMINILENYILAYNSALTAQPDTKLVARAVILLLLTFFGYETPQIRALQPKLVRERLQDTLLGFILGALNGYLLIGSLWFFLHQAGYPTDLIITSGEGWEELAGRYEEVMRWLAPNLLPIPHIFFAVGVVFVVILVVFV